MAAAAQDDGPPCSLSRNFARAVKVDAKALRRLDEILRVLASDLGYTAELADHSSLQFSDVELLITYENPKLRAITSLRARSGYKSRGTVTVEITNDTLFGTTVSLRADGPDKLVGQVVRDFQTWLADVEQSSLYSSFARQSTFSLFAWSFGSLWVGIGILSGIKSGHFSFALSRPKADKETESTFLGTLVGLAVFAEIPGGIAAVLNKCRATFWPVAVFAIGQGAERYARVENQRNWVFVGLLVPLLLTIVSLTKC